MTREIKFRGKAAGTWYFGNLQTRKISRQQSAAWIIGYDESPILVSVDPSTVGQFTGLYDKNGKEIYEGDIVRTLVSRLNATKNKKYRNFVIRYDAPYFWNGYDTLLMSKWRMEVIGNTYDNRDMLRRED